MSRLPPSVEAAVARYLGLADRALPGRIIGFHVVGSVALGGYRPARSDIDFVAILDRSLDAAELRRLKAAIVASGVRSALPDLARGRLSLPGVCNGVFITADDVAKPVTTIVPVASHAGHSIQVGQGFDANPVVWKTFAEHGITVRGDDASTLPLDPEPDRLEAWNRDNLVRYWQPWAERAAHGRGGFRTRLSPRWLTAWGALGPPRLHHTIATGEVISKEAAGEYAKDTFGAEWHPVLDEALAYWREEPSPGRQPLEATGRFALHVINSARRASSDPT